MTITTPHPVHAGRGRLPRLPEHIGSTTNLLAAETAVLPMPVERDIVGFDGRSGTGKTTAAAHCLSGMTGVRWCYLQAPQRAHPKVVVQAMHEAVLGTAGRGIERQILVGLVDVLATGEYGLVVDEVHHVGLPGMQQIRYMHDEATRLDSAFPLLLIGCDLYNITKGAQELHDRISRWVMFDKVTDDADVLEVAAALHPRLAATPIKQLKVINERIASGGLRAWREIAKTVKYLPSTQDNDRAPLTSKDVNQIRNLLGRRS